MRSHSLSLTLVLIISKVQYGNASPSLGGINILILPLARNTAPSEVRFAKEITVNDFHDVCKSFSEAKEGVALGM